MENETSNFSKFAPNVFDGNNYHVWAVRMKTYMEALDLWNAVEEEYDTTLTENPTMAQLKAHKDLKIKESKTKACLFAAISANIFTSILSLESPKKIWEYLKKEYEGDAKINGIKVLNLIREFELQKMKDGEMIKDYSERLLGIAYKVRLLGTEFPESRIVQKILVTIPERYEAVITTLENTKDFSKISLVELINALQAQEQRRMMRNEEGVEGAFRAKIDNAGGVNNYNKYPTCAYCKKTNHPQSKCWWRADMKCNRCGQLGHMERICKFQERDKAKEATTVEHEEDLLF